MNYPEDARNLLNAEDVLQRVMLVALDRSLDSIASLILYINPSIIRKDMIAVALRRGCTEFLRKVWTGNQKLKKGVQA
jgi:hypothetical protein